MTDDELKERLREYVDSVTERSKGKQYKCPLCGSGNSGRAGSDGAFSIDNSGRKWKCFACQAGGDIFDLAGAVNATTDYTEQKRIIYRFFGIDADSDTKTGRTKRQSTPRTRLQGVAGIGTPQSGENARKALKNAITENGQNQGKNASESDLESLFLEAHEKLISSETGRAYLAQRGISIETARRFNLGYIDAWIHPNAPASVPKTPRLIIPTSAGRYLARLTREPKNDNEKKHAKMKVGNGLLYNVEAMQQTSAPVFIVEGELDAISIEQAGGRAVGLGSLSGIHSFLQAVDSAPASRFIIALDAEQDKRKQANIQSAEKTLEAGLAARGKCAIIRKPFIGQKDANAALCADSDAFGQALRACITEAENAPSRYREENSARGLLVAFGEEVARRAKTHAIATGFTILDAWLDGGLYEGLYIVGAITSLGKTTFCLQAVDNAAQAGNDVLIFALEMSQFELVSKSLSRETWHACRETAMTARKISNGNYTARDRRAISEALQRFKEYAGNVFIYEGVGDIGVDQIRETVQRHVAATGRVPVVLVDYLQILAPALIGATDKQNTDKAVLELKRLSRDYKTPVIAISSLNRAAYNKRISLEDFKESGAIEYSVDVLLGLQLKGAGEKGHDANAAKGAYPRKIEAVILKNRNGVTGKSVFYDFHSKYNVFTESIFTEQIELPNNNDN